VGWECDLQLKCSKREYFQPDLNWESELPRSLHEVLRVHVCRQRHNQTCPRSYSICSIFKGLRPTGDGPGAHLRVKDHK
jgi:hypothetical protein